MVSVFLNVQAAFKYWLVLVLVFEVTLMVMYSQPVMRPLNPAFGFVAASLAMSEKVEATVSKVSQSLELLPLRALISNLCCLCVSQQATTNDKQFWQARQTS